jgi:hypothetical protein
MSAYEHSFHTGKSDVMISVGCLTLLARRFPYSHSKRRTKCKKKQTYLKASRYDATGIVMKNVQENTSTAGLAAMRVNSTAGHFDSTDGASIIDARRLHVAVAATPEPDRFPARP